MTVGQELAKRTEFKLFHNHMTIEMVAPFFSYGTKAGRALVHKLRDAFFDAFVESDAAGYIFTYVWAFGEKGEREYIEGIANRFAQKGCEVFWVELEADLEERIKRNRSENRLLHKPTKRDLEWSENNLRETQEKYRINSEAGEISQPNYLRIDSTSLSAAEVAERVRRFTE